MRLRLILTLAAIISLATLLMADPGMERVEDVTRQSVPAESFSGVNVQNINGRISITGDASTDSVIVIATKSICAPNEERGRELLSMIEVNLDQESDTLRISVETPEDWCEDYSVGFNVRVPPRFAVVSRTSNGRVSVSGVESACIRVANGSVNSSQVSALHVRTSNGSVEADAVSGPVDLKTVNGSVHARLASVTDSVRIATSNGRVTLEVPEETGAELSACCTSGLIRTQDIALTGGHSSRSQLTGTIGSGGPDINLRTVSGSIHIRSYR